MAGRVRRRVLLAHCALLPCVLFLSANNLHAESKQSLRAQRTERIKNPFEALSFFPKKFNAKKVVDVVDLTDVPMPSLRLPKRETVQAESETIIPQPTSVDAVPDVSKLPYRSDDIAETKVLPAHLTPEVRIEKDAPSCFKAMMAAKRAGNTTLAQDYAAQCIRQQQLYFFEVREVTQMLGKALIAQKVIDEDDWDGVGQAMERGLAASRQELGALIKPTHDVAMQRIKADPKQEVEVFYFFSLNCSWCRYMAPDAERLWRLSQSDPRIKMTALTIGETPEEWMSEYRDYTGLTMPIFAGDQLARELNIKYVPAVVVVAPTINKAYMKSGQQSFERLYEFVRTVQGVPATVTAQFKQLIETPIGQAELLHAKNDVHTVYVTSSNSKGRRARLRHPERIEKAQVAIERF